MPFFRILILIAFAAIASQPARAQTYQIYQPGQITLGDFTLSLSACSYILNSVTQASCSADNTDVNLSVNSRGNVLTMTYLNQSKATAPLMNQASAAGCTCVYYTLDLTSTAPISSALLSDSGYNSQSGNVLNSQATFTSVSGSPAIAATIPNGVSSATASYAFASNTNSVDINLGLGQNGAFNGDTLSLNHATVVFTAAPEPATVLVFLTGLAGLVAVRRKTQQSRHRVG